MPQGIFVLYNKDIGKQPDKEKAMQIINRVPNFKDTLAHHIVSALEAHNDPAVLVDLMAVFQGELKIGRDGTVIGIFWTGINKNWHVVTTNRKIRKADDN